MTINSENSNMEKRQVAESVLGLQLATRHWIIRVLVSGQTGG